MADFVPAASNGEHRYKYAAIQAISRRFDRDYSLAHPASGTTTREPSMTILMSSIDLTDLRRRLTADGYSRHTIRTYVSTVREFLRDLDKRGIALETVDRSHVFAYLQRRFVRYQAAHHRAPPSANRWGSQNLGGIPYFLRAALGNWPRLPAPQSPREAVDRLTLLDYRGRLAATTDFAEGTVEGLVYEAKRFLIGSRANNSATEELQLTEMDDYVKFRAHTIRRTTCKTVTKRVAHFLSVSDRTVHGRTCQ
jgi:hypothetical protein